MTAIREVKIPGQGAKSGRIKTAPQGVGSTARGLTHRIDYTDWRATVNGTRTCTIDGCDRGGLLTRGLCKTHYARVLRHGDAGAAEVKVARYNGAKCEHCDRTATANGLCAAHYKRMRRHGSPTAPHPILSEDERFLPHVGTGPIPHDRPGLGACWEWTGTRGRNGYGYVSTPNRGSHRLAHRVSYERYVGPIPAGMVIDHLCRNRGCVNPDHLEVVTNEENLRRGLGYRLQNGMDNACRKGHIYTPENTYRSPSGGTSCRTCQRENDKNRKRA